MIYSKVFPASSLGSLAAVVAASFAPAALAQQVPFHAGSVVQFASVKEGAALLAREDEFTRALSRFDLQARLKTRQDVTAKDLTAFAARQVEAWSGEEGASIARSLESLRERLKEYPPLFPETVLLVKTTGEEEGGAAYCRQNAIVLPRRMLQRSEELMERLLAHELFHILSRHDPQRRRRMYAVVGFQPCGEIELPPSLRERKITNPDAPTLDDYVELRTENGVVPAMPILYSTVESYDLSAEKTFFHYL
jgi:hypothetical protein